MITPTAPVTVAKSAAVQSIQVAERVGHGKRSARTQQGAEEALHRMMRNEVYETCDALYRPHHISESKNDFEFITRGQDTAAYCH